MRGTRSGSRRAAVAVEPVVDRAIARAVDQFAGALRDAANAFAEQILARAFLDAAFAATLPHSTVEPPAEPRAEQRATSRAPRTMDSLAKRRGTDHLAPPDVGDAARHEPAPHGDSGITAGRPTDPPNPPRDLSTARQPEPRVAMIVALRALGDRRIPIGLAAACREQFGSIRAARRAVRLNTDRWSRASILDYLRTEPRGLPRDLSVAITELFGTLEGAREAAGLPRTPPAPPRSPWPPSPRSPSEVLAALREIGDGRVPTALQRRAQRMFGSFNAARVAAGLPVLLRQPGRPRTSSSTLNADKARRRNEKRKARVLARQPKRREHGLDGLRSALATLGRVPLPGELPSDVWRAIQYDCGGLRKAVAIVQDEQASRQAPNEHAAIDAPTRQPRSRSDVEREGSRSA